jgi:signal transduction histidine kinase
MARLSTPPRPTALQPFAQTEHVIAVCRVMLACSTLALVIVDPTLPSYRRDIAYPVLLVYLGLSLVIFALVRSDYLRRRERVAIGSTAMDIGWIALMTLFTGTVASPFFLLNVFVILSVSVRWGLRVAGPVTVLLAVLYPGTIAVGRLFDPAEFPFHRAQFLRPIYLLPIGYLLAYLGEHERRTKAKLAFMLSLALPSGADARVGRALTRVVRRTLQHFSARYGVVVLHDPETGRYFSWELRRDGDRTAMNLRITERDPYPLPFLGPTEGMLVNHFERTARSGLCYDIHTGVVTRRPIPSGASLPHADAAVSALVAPIVVMRHELRGRAFLLRDAGRRFTRDDLELLLLLAGQVANTLESRRLQAFAENVAVLEERARIARDLHDGFIQSLAGIDLRVAACKTWLQRDPTQLPKKLDDLHEAVDRGYKEVRRFLNVLRTTSRPPADLGGTLDRLAQDFSNREGVQVLVERPKGILTLPDTTTHELTQIVREALNNAVRHGRATDVRVTLAAAASGIELAVRDNGHGFNGASTPDADGYLPLADQPWSIRERTDALGGRLRVRSQAGEGAEISLSLPITTRRDL